MTKEIKEIENTPEKAVYQFGEGKDALILSVAEETDLSEVMISTNGDTRKCLEKYLELKLSHKDEPLYDLFELVDSRLLPYNGNERDRTDAVKKLSKKLFCDDSKNSSMVKKLLSVISGNPLIDEMNRQMELLKGTQDKELNKSKLTKIRNKIAKKIDNAFNIKNKISSIEFPDPSDPGVVSVLGLAALVTGMAIGTAFRHYNNKSEVTTLKTSTLNDEANTKLFTAAFENDLSNFKKAIKDGAKITTPNQHNQNALMVALARRSYDVSGYILSTPELRGKIDYKQADDKGVTAMDIIQSEIDYALKHNSTAPAPELEMAKRIVTEQLQEQNREEARGQARSNIKYDTFAIAMQKQENTRK